MRVPGQPFIKVEPKVADLVWGRDGNSVVGNRRWKPTAKGKGDMSALGLIHLHPPPGTPGLEA
jgi:hypothetical protein